MTPPTTPPASEGQRPKHPSGKLLHAGSFVVAFDYTEAREPVTGFVVASTEDEIRALKTIPIHERVVIVPEAQHATLAAQVAALTARLVAANRDMMTGDAKPDWRVSEVDDYHWFLQYGQKWLQDRGNSRVDEVGPSDIHDARMEHAARALSAPETEGRG